MTPLLLVILTATSCRTGISYTGGDAPFYYGGPGGTQPSVRGADVLRVVSFNVKYARQIERAIQLLEEEPSLADADVILLQEMDENGAWLIAEALGMHYVYHPAVLHIRTGRDFGNAILSRWPIVDHERILLPHVGRFTRTRRAATAATLDVAGTEVRVYSVHLATIVELGPRRRAEQLCTIVADALLFPRAIIAGDLNSSTVAEAAERMGMLWPTASGPRTSLAGRLDHILLHGLPAIGRTGVVRNVRGSSDHRPVWAEVHISR